MSQNDSRRRIVEELTQQLRRLERSRKIAAPATAGEKDAETGGLKSTLQEMQSSGVGLSDDITDLGGLKSTLLVSTGIVGLDRLLPEGGLRRGTLVEWLAEGEGTGTGTLVLSVARQAMHERGVLVVIDVQGDFYPLAAAGHGIDLAQLIVVRPTRTADVLWACDQSLRCTGVAAVLCGLDRLHDRAFRRLQLAAERGGSLGLLLRPAARLREPSWADVRLLVQPVVSQEAPSHGCVRHGLEARATAYETSSHEAGAGRRLRVELLRCRGGMNGQTILLEIDDETGLVRVVSELAPPAAERRASRRSGA